MALQCGDLRAVINCGVNLRFVSVCQTRVPTRAKRSTRYCWRRSRHASGAWAPGSSATSTGPTVFRRHRPGRRSRSRQRDGTASRNGKCPALVPATPARRRLNTPTPRSSWIWALLFKKSTTSDGPFGVSQTTL